MAGRVEAIYIAPEGGAPMRALEGANAVPGAGLEGDRYLLGTGYYSSRPSPGGRELTLIEAEVLAAVQDEIGVRLAPGEDRRNITTRGIALNELVGKRFYVGEVLCEGTRLCDPCQYIEDLTGKPLFRPLVHRGGVRAKILTAGTIHRGDEVREVDEEGRN